MAVFIVMFTFSGVLLAALALPLIRRSVPPNGWYGLRVAATFADESVWYDANARSGRDLLIIGVVQVVLALLLPLAGLAEEAYALANAAYLVVAVLVMAVAGVRRANRMLRERGVARVDD